jgi:hypothetical protein
VVRGYFSPVPTVPVDTGDQRRHAHWRPFPGAAILRATRARTARYRARRTGPAQCQVRSCCGITVCTVADLAMQASNYFAGLAATCRS